MSSRRAYTVDALEVVAQIRLCQRHMSLDVEREMEYTAPIRVCNLERAIGTECGVTDCFKPAAYLLPVVLQATISK